MICGKDGMLLCKITAFGAVEKQNENNFWVKQNKARNSFCNRKCYSYLALFKMQRANLGFKPKCYTPCMSKITPIRPSTNFFSRRCGINLEHNTYRTAIRPNASPSKLEKSNMFHM